MERNDANDGCYRGRKSEQKIDEKIEHSTAICNAHRSSSAAGGQADRKETTTAAKSHDLSPLLLRD